MTKKEASYADLEALPDHLIGEIIDGELVVAPRPRPRHSHTATMIIGDLIDPFHHGRNGPGGWWILLEPEIKLGRNVMVPDAAGWRRSRVPELPDVVPLELTPDWACEVLSPSTARLDRGKKLRIYAEHGIGHLWLVDPVARTLEGLERQERRMFVAAVHGGDDRARAAPFDAIEIDLARWWLPLPTGAAEPVIDWHRDPL